MIQSFDCEECTGSFQVDYDDVLHDLTPIHCVFCGEFLLHDDEVIRGQSLDDGESVDV